MSQQLTREDLFSLEQYAEKRAEFRQQVLAHKAPRNVPIGPNATLIFEDRLTIQYQIQEMLRIERTFEANGIQEELDAYNPLIPDGRNWKATFMIEYPDPAQRQKELARLIGIEDKVWVRVDDQDKVYAIADEDLERDNAEKTSAVHFLRFELTDDMARALKQGAALSMGIDHPNYPHATGQLPEATRQSLQADLD